MQLSIFMNWIRMKLQDRTLSSNPMVVNWSSLWKLDVPSKIHHFLWELLKNKLPCYVNLQGRGVMVETICQGCGFAREDTEHALLKCPDVKDLWRQLPLPSRLDKVPVADMWSLFTFILKNCNVQGQQMAVIALWWVWYRRNNLLYKGKTIPVQIVLSKIMTFQAEWSARERDSVELHRTHLGQQQVNTRSGVRWIAPPLGTYKLNCDAAWNSSTGQTRIGIIARDGVGQIMVSAGIPVTDCSSAEEAELMAVLECAKLARDFFLSPIIKGQIPQSSLSFMYSDVIFVSRAFSSCVFQFTPREGDSVAHALARWAKDLDSSIILMEDCSASIWSLVCNDCAGLFL